ncbi:transcription factor ATOH8 [Centruroides vittatus]|uniref:transcription factor ATOH8 n=1 Tax=Centruroides vittatus TaxID=120091 RepID=UPI00350FF624
MATSSTCPGVEPEADHSDDSGCGCRVTSQLGTPVSPGCRKNKRKSSEPKRRTDVLQMKRFRWESDASDSDCLYEAADRERPSSGDSGCQLGSGIDSWPSPESPCKSSTPARQTVIQRGEVAVPDSKNCKAETELKPGTSGEAQRFREPHDPSDDDQYSPRNRQGYRPRNYKSMSRQRRIEANARERTRVHTISAAFESLRRAVPAYADSQKLSKLAILRIASTYILSLACLNNLDYSRDQKRPTFSECVDLCTKTIQAEGRTRRRGKE